MEVHHVGKLYQTSGFDFGALLLGLFAYTPYEAVADTDVTVNDSGDFVDPSPNIGGCSSTNNTCTLRAAIQRANHRLTGTHTIHLPAGNFFITRAGRGEDDAVSGDLDIKGNIVIIGPGRSPRASSVITWTGCST